MGKHAQEDYFVFVSASAACKDDSKETQKMILVGILQNRELNVNTDLEENYNSVLEESCKLEINSANNPDAINLDIRCFNKSKIRRLK